MEKNTGASFEEKVYELISKIVNNNEFMVAAPNVRIRKKPRYYSKDRESEIEFDMSVEKYLGNPDEHENLRPSIIVIIECKDYSKSIPVDDVEELHAKLQQIGADNTKGMMITQNGHYQRSALAYANTKGIALARLHSSDQIDFALHYTAPQSDECYLEKLILDLLGIDPWKCVLSRLKSLDEKLRKDKVNKI